MQFLGAWPAVNPAAWRMISVFSNGLFVADTRNEIDETARFVSSEILAAHPMDRDSSASGIALSTGILGADPSSAFVKKNQGPGVVGSGSIDPSP
jgi:hypothetical protein